MSIFETELFHSLLGVSVIAVIVIACGSLLAHRRYFFWGVSTAYIAFLIATAISEALRFLHIELPMLMTVVVSPLVEEVLRVFVIFAFFSDVENRNRSTWILFVLGFAILETVVKYTDFLPLLFQHDELAARATILSTPLIPFFLHTTLALLVFTLRARGLPFLAVLLAAFTLHAIHNSVVVALEVPESWEKLLFINLFRIGVFALLIGLLVKDWYKSSAPG